VIGFICLVYDVVIVVVPLFKLITNGCLCIYAQEE